MENLKHKVVSSALGAAGGLAGLGTLSFRLMTCEATLELVNNGVGQG